MNIEKAARLAEKAEKVSLLGEIGGWFGMVLIHGATLPTSISVIAGWSTHVPPLDMVLMIWLGLGCFLIRSVTNFDMLYLVSNCGGFTAQSVLLLIVLFGGF